VVVDVPQLGRARAEPAPGVLEAVEGGGVGHPQRQVVGAPVIPAVEPEDVQRVVVGGGGSAADDVAPDRAQVVAPDDVGDGTQVRDLLVGRAAGGGVVVDAGIRLRAELLDDGSRGSVANQGGDVCDPLGVGPGGIREAVAVHGEVDPVEAGVVAQGPDVASPAAAVELGALDEQPVAGNSRRVLPGDPGGGEVKPLRGSEPDGLVDRVEVDQGVVQVLGRDGVPHLVPGGQETGRDHVRAVLGPVREDDLEAPGDG